MNRTTTFTSSRLLAAFAAAAAFGLACANEEAGTKSALAVPSPASASAVVPTATMPTAATVPEAAASTAVAPPPATAASAAATTPAAAPPFDVTQLPDVVARLNGVDITRHDLLTRGAEARAALAQRGLAPPPESAGFYRQVLDDLLGNRLLYLDLAAQGKAASAAEIDQQVQAIRANFASDEEFDKSLQARGFDRERLRREIVEGLTVARWIRESIEAKIVVPPAEVQKFYDANSERMVEPEGVHARHILIQVEAESGPEARTAQRERAEEIRQKLVGGADFAALARESSDDKGSGARGGDLGWLPRGRTVPPFEQAAFALEPGKLSELVETRFGFHLIEVLEKRAAGKVSLDKARPRIEATLKQRQLEEMVRAQVNELGKQAKIEILL